MVQNIMFSTLPVLHEQHPVLHACALFYLLEDVLAQLLQLAHAWEAEVGHVLSSERVSDCFFGVCMLFCCRFLPA